MKSAAVARRPLVPLVIALVLGALLPLPGASGAVDLQRTGQRRTSGPPIPPLADGTVRAGLAWLPERFLANGDGTATDQVTGLDWLLDCNLMVSRDPGFDTDGTPGDGYVGWARALEYVAALNADLYLGHADWRLPNRYEMRSLVDFSRSSPALPAGHPFSNVQLSYYWTASDYFDDSQMFSDWAWYLHFGSGLCGGDNKLTSHHVWPVRDGYVGASSSTLSDPDPVSSTWLFFPDTPTGQTATKVLAVASSGQSPLVVGAIRLDGAAGAVFAVTADTCSGAIVQPGASCTVTLRFAPTAVGTTWDTFHLPSSSDQTWTRQLTVVGSGLFSAQIFADGFEGGSTGSWSNTVG